MSMDAAIHAITFTLHVLPRLATPIAVLRKVLFAVAALTIPATLVLLASPVLLAAFWTGFRQWAIASTLQHVIATALLVMIAGAFYLIRQTHKAIYGTAEALIGMFGGWAATANIEATSFGFAVAIFTSVYVMVRGFVNISDGRREPVRPGFIQNLQTDLLRLEEMLRTMRGDATPRPV